MKKFLTPKNVARISFGLWSIAAVSGTALYMGYGMQNLACKEEPCPPTAPIYKKIDIQSQIPSLKEALATKSFTLEKTARLIKFPDLRSVLVYYGSHGRPDVTGIQSTVHFGLRGSPTVYSALKGEKVYLRFDVTSTRWCVENKKTPLSVIFKPSGPVVDVTTILDESQEAVKVIDEYAHFSLSSSPPPPNQGLTGTWKLHIFNVDSALLDHFGALWYGKDCMLEKLGGEEMSEDAASERVEFHHDNLHYTLFLQPDDYCVFNGTTWEKTVLGEESIKHPLLHIETITDTTISCRIWDKDGNHQAAVMLHKKPVSTQFELPKIRILAARSQQNITIELQGKKISINPQDWFIISPNNELTLIDNEELLDSYIQGQLKGNLLAFSGLERVEKEQCLVGLYFDSTRTQTMPLCVSMYRSWAAKQPDQNKKEKIREDEEDEEIDEDDLFIDDEEEILDEDDLNDEES